ncbi:MAG: hypothetical protein HYY96_03700 [Candidatus Tectomicrobia bacterium]|nr:hypothetical protein [Candidatus Tectomicrobia bacterium]
MAWKIFSDIHGAYEAVIAQLAPDDTAFLLGDYLDLLEFEQLEGIVPDLVGRNAVGEALRKAQAGEPGEFRALVRATLHPGGEHFEALLGRAAGEYDRCLASLPCQSYILHGNTDFPDLVRQRCNGTVAFVDGRSIEVDGTRVGFVGGCLQTPHALAGEEETSAYEAKFDALGQVDVLFMHIPPDLPDITYDVKARRKEACSKRAVEYLRDVQPAFVYFGHVHNPRSHTATLGRTQITNVGYFRRHQRATIHWRGRGRATEAGR